MVERFKPDTCDWCEEEGRWIFWEAVSPIDEFHQHFHGFPGPTSIRHLACDAHRNNLAAYGCKIKEETP